MAWWGGIGLILSGVLLATGYDKYGLGEFTFVVSALLGGAMASPAHYILLGFSVIGLRAKQERDGLALEQQEVFDNA